MTRTKTRRDFLENLGFGAMITAAGPVLANELGAWRPGIDDPGKPTFGDLEPLVGLMQDTAPDALQPKLVKLLKSGDADLKRLVMAGALANARKFGGEHYNGYHALMAMIPALEIARELPKEAQPLPVLKVLHRSTSFIQKAGGSRRQALQRVQATELPAGAKAGDLLKQAVIARDRKKAEGIFAKVAEGQPRNALNTLQYTVHDDTDVHRIVLAHRAWELLDVCGREHAHTLLRQSVRYCVDWEGLRLKRGWPVPTCRTILPKLLDEFRLLAKPLGTRRPENAWVEKTAAGFYRASQTQAATTVAGLLADGIAPDAISEALVVAANALVLRAPKNKRAHGATRGVHASDAINAWKNMVRVSNPRNVVACLVTAACQVAGGSRFGKGALPHESNLEDVKGRTPASLLAEAEDAIKRNDQGRAAAAIQRYGEHGFDAKPVFALMRRYAISEDGRLHAEKYYRTVVEEYAEARAPFRWRQLVALARVTASSFGYDLKDRPGHRAPGYAQARRLLGV